MRSRYSAYVLGVLEYTAASVGGVTFCTQTGSGSGTAVATVSAAGVVTGVTAGTATISATASGVSGSATITVTGSPTDAFQTTVPTIDLNAILARPTESSTTVSLWSASARTATITLTPGNRVISQPLTAATLATVDLTGLSPDQAYQYRVDAPGATSISGSFRTARGPGTSYRFVMQADSHLDNNSDLAIYANTLANMVADAPDFLIDLGDTFMTDKYADYHSAAAQYYAQRYWFGLVGRTMPVYLVQGNHDGELAWLPAVQTWAAGQRTTYFPSVISNAFYSSALTPRNYFAWTWGDALFVVIDPYWSSPVPVDEPFGGGTKHTNAWDFTHGDAQYQWLKQTLEQSKAKYKFVFAHHVMGTGRGGVEVASLWECGGKDASGKDVFSVQRPSWASTVHQLMVKNGVTIFFQGHDHVWALQSLNGVTYQTLSVPADPNYGIGFGASYLSGDVLPSSGYTRVSVSPQRVKVDYVRTYLSADETSSQRSGSVAFSYTLP